MLAEDNEFQLSLLSNAQRAELDTMIAEKMNADGSLKIDKYIKDNTNEKAERVDKTAEDGGVQQVERGGKELSQDVTPKSDAKKQVGGPLESIESTAKALEGEKTNETIFGKLKNLVYFQNGERESLSGLQSNTRTDSGVREVQPTSE